MDERPVTLDPILTGDGDDGTTDAHSTHRNNHGWFNFTPYSRIPLWSLQYQHLRAAP